MTLPAGGNTDVILIGDPRVRGVSVHECGEAFVDLRGIHPRILVDSSRSQIASNSDLFCCTRFSVAQKLVEAAGYLPRGWFYVIKEAYRSPERQRKSFDSVTRHYRDLFPGLPEDELFDRVCGYVAPPDCAPHPTGGAVDLTLCDSKAREIDMGTEFNAVPEESGRKTWTRSPLLNRWEIEHRAILIRAMTAAGFVNYPTEWWHWSYGDRYWALMSSTTAMYGPCCEEMMEVIRYDVS